MLMRMFFAEVMMIAILLIEAQLSVIFSSSLSLYKPHAMSQLVPNLKPSLYSALIMGLFPF